jgi:anti-sigma B factor antagonist
MATEMTKTLDDGWIRSGPIVARTEQEAAEQEATAGGGAGVRLSVVTTRLAGDVEEIRLRGEIDVDTAGEVRDAVAAVLSRCRPSRINLNLRLVSFIDSVGISALVAGFQTAQVSGVKLLVTEPSRFVHRQLWVTGLLGLFGAPEPYLEGQDSEPADPARPGAVRPPASP